MIYRSTGLHGPKSVKVEDGWVTFLCLLPGGQEQEPVLTLEAGDPACWRVGSWLQEDPHARQACMEEIERQAGEEGQV